MKRIKVIMIGSNNTVKGGITSVINQLLNYNWNNENIDMIFLATFIDGNKISKMLFFLKGYIKFIRIIFKENPDIIHIHMSHNGSFYRKLIIHKTCKLFKKKDIIHLHSSEFKEFYLNSNKLIRKIICNMLKEASSILVLGKKWNDFIIGIEPQAKTIILNNTIGLPEFKKIIQYENINILFLGVLVKRKGTKDLLFAANELNKLGVLEQYSVKFIICGDGEEKEELVDYINKNNLSNYIKMVGWISGEKKSNYLKKSDVFVLPSYNEGLPISILEAMSYGLPIISTSVGSIDEAVIDNFNGYLIEPGDTNKLVLYLKEIIVNKDKRINFGLNSQKLVNDKFNDKKYYESIIKHYKGLMDIDLD